MEARLRRLDGEYRWFQFCARPLVDASGQIVKWCGTGTDIDDLRRSAMGQPGGDDDYRSVADIIPAMIAFLTPAGEIENANRHVLEYLGVTLEELKGRQSKRSDPSGRSSVGDRSLGASGRHGTRSHTTSSTAYAVRTASIAGFMGA